VSTMPRPRKPFTHKETSRHGKVVWYFRRGKGERVRLPGPFGSKEFNEAYAKAAAGQPVENKPKATKKTLQWLMNDYLSSQRYSRLKPNTQRNHRLMLASVLKSGAANWDIADITSEDIQDGLVAREGTPSLAHSYVSIMRSLFTYAKDHKYVHQNPVTPDIRAAQVKNDGFHTWTLEEVAQFERRHPVGTQARLAMDIMLYTGLRRSDAVQLGRQHIKKGVIQYRAIKNDTDITIPVLAPMAKSIQATKTGDMILLFNANGQAWDSNAFGPWFRRRCDEAGLPHCTAHGLRKAGATIAANNGATPFQLTAMYGWSSTKMAEVYTKKADRVRLAEQAANKLFPHPEKGEGINDKLVNPNN
jgi:integrase